MIDPVASGKTPAYTDPVRNAVMALQAGNTMLLYVLDSSMKDNPDVLIDGVVLYTTAPSVRRR